MRGLLWLEHSKFLCNHMTNIEEEGKGEKEKRQRWGDISHVSFKDKNPVHEFPTSLSESSTSKHCAFESRDPKNGSDKDTFITQ